MLSQDVVNLIIVALPTLVTSVSITWLLAWWLSGKFSDQKSYFYVKFEELKRTFEDKLEYHEKHDDQRFQTLNNELWMIRVRNAAREGVPVEDKGK